MPNMDRRVPTLGKAHARQKSWRGARYLSQQGAPELMIKGFLLVIACNIGFSIIM